MVACKKNISAKAALIILICLMQIPWVSETADRLIFARSSHYSDATIGMVSANIAWTTYSWNPTADQHFRAIESQVLNSRIADRVKESGRFDAVLAPYREDVWYHPADADKVFRLAVAASIAEKVVWTLPEDPSRFPTNCWLNVYPEMHHIQHWLDYLPEEPFQTIYNAHREPKPPHSYLFDRYMVKALMSGGPYFDQWNVAGVDNLLTRMIKQNPQDTVVANWRISRFQGRVWDDYKWAKLAIKRAEEALSQNPGIPDRILIAAQANYSLYDNDIWVQKSYGDIALKEFKRYLEVKTSRSHQIFARDAIRRIQTDPLIRAKYRNRKEWIQIFTRKR